MRELLRNLFKGEGSWKTTISGLLIFICGGSELAGLVPPDLHKYLAWVCLTALTFGFISAKDYNLSNSPVPKGAASPVHKSVDELG